jgi:hypothetical protein
MTLQQRSAWSSSKSAACRRASRGNHRHETGMLEPISFTPLRSFTYPVTTKVLRVARHDVGFPAQRCWLAVGHG